MVKHRHGQRHGREVGREVLAPLLALSGWCAFASYLIVQARAGPVIGWNDSAVYSAVASKPLWSHAFWVAPRPPLTPLLIKLVGSSSAFTTAQAVIGALSWGFLAWTVGRLAPVGWRRVGATWATLAFATTLPITLWNRSVLSESLSMSLLALVFAGGIWTSRRPTWPRVATTAVACLCLAATRDSEVWTVAMLGAAVVVWAVTRRSATQRVAVLAGCLLAAVVVTGWGTLASHRSTEVVGDVYVVRIFPYPERVAWFAAHGMPQQHRIDQLATSMPPAPHTAKTVTIAPDDPAFGPLRRWITTRGTGTYLLWLATHPWYVVTEPLQRPERSFNFYRGDLADYAATSNPMTSPLTPVLWPSLLGLDVMAAMAIALGARSGAWRQPAWRAVAVLAAIGIPAMLIAWHGDGQEVTRHTVEGFAELRLGVWILLVIGLVGSRVASAGTHEATTGR